MFRSRHPSRPSRRCSRESVSRPRPTTSGSNLGRTARHLGLAARYGSPDAVEKIIAWPGTSANGLSGCLQGGARGRDLRGVALGVGGCGRDDRQPGRRREWDGESHLSGRRRSSPPASRGSPRPRRSRRSRKRSWRRSRCGRSCRASCRHSHPSSWPSAVVTMIGKFWRLLGPWRGELEL